uniref:F-box DNA helicase 1 n=1 Tax=Euleptes europaea TaxID=460621 RepID=UPI002541ED6A|nr:F-box DNA helicase 1 [Euleptes europaea]
MGSCPCPSNGDAPRLGSQGWRGGPAAARGLFGAEREGRDPEVNSGHGFGRPRRTRKNSREWPRGLASRGVNQRLGGGLLAAGGQRVRRFKRLRLSADDCDALNQSPEGTAALTQPFSQRQSSRDSNRGLYPSYRTKKHPRGHQRTITDYFRIKAHPSPCADGSAQSSQIKVEDSPESCSLLCGEWNLAPVASESRPRFSQSASNCPMDSSHGDQDTRTLSDGVCEPSPYQAGIKEEFDDMDFDPLPDACFGLLGTTPWTEPQGHIDQLPDEVLRAIFALVPTVDLYQSLSLVSHRWREIISDPQFVPWKKLYLRYLKKESQALLTVDATRRQYGLIKEQDQCMLGLIRCIVALKSHQRWDTRAILECLESHPLFPVAEICIIHRLPYLESPIEGMPNVWAVMAAIVLFSGSLGDIQKLVSCLQRPGSTLSLVDVTEALYCMATLLHAMRADSVNVSNRIHYNLFYCLWQMENSSCGLAVAKPEISCPESGYGYQGPSRPAIQPTREQQHILNHMIEPGQVVKIVAFAGTGKTSTLIKYAQKWSNLRFLYVAFNKTTAEQGSRVFPQNVTCKTLHSLAFMEVGRHYSQKGKLNLGSLSSYSVSFVLQNRLGQSLFIRAKLVVRTLEAFFASRDAAITDEHTPIWCRNTHGEKVLIRGEEKTIVIEEANRIWKNMKSLRPTTRTVYKMTHDGYLKLWQLSKPRLSNYDVIFVDEAQDCTPAVMDVVLSQPCGIILVGDPHQQIYTFRGAVNALDEVPHTHLFYLTRSFRFGPEIAYVGASILDICKGVRNKTLVGGIQEGDVTGGEPRGKVAILCRGNEMVFDFAVNVTRGDPPAKIHLLGGLQAFGLEKIRDIWNLLHSELGFEVKDPFVKRWAEKGFQALKSYAASAEDKQLQMRIAIVERHVNYIPLLLDRISRCHTPSPEAADFVLGTVHKAKGLEFDTVQVADDFMMVPLARHNLDRTPSFHVGKIPADEWNLLYVAVTRAKRRLIMSQFLCRLLTLAGEYYLRPELTSEVCRREPVECCVQGCPNYIPNNSFVTMKKRPFVYSDGAEDREGYLCHSCVERRLGPLTWLAVSPEVMETLEPTEEVIALNQNYYNLILQDV